MIYKHMYRGYKKEGKVEFLDDQRIITSSGAEFDGITYIYFETKCEELDIEDVVKAEMKPYPDGKGWFELTEIFHYFTPYEDSQWERKVTEKTPKFRINHLKKNMISSYIYHHVAHQNTNQYGYDKFLSIFNVGDTIIMYSESPSEKITWQDIEGRQFIPQDSNEWDNLMDKHFKAWENGEKKWILMPSCEK